MADEPPTVALPDGRDLAYETFGRADGDPIVCLHGIPGSRLVWSLFDEVAQHRDLCLIAPDRPGFGYSDFQPDRTLLDWPDDVAHLAEALDLDEFGVVGFSGGGPHAAACAYAMPERVRGVVLVGSGAPPSVYETSGVGIGRLSRATQVPGVSRAVFGAAGWLARHWHSRFRSGMARGLPAADRELFAGPEGDVLIEDAAEAFRQNGKGPAHEFPLLAQPWGFGPRDLNRPVTLFHGEQDQAVPIAVARAFADALAQGDLTTVDAAHYSTLVENGEEILVAARDGD